MLPSPSPFIDSFNAWSFAHAPAALADHIGYKCASHEEFEDLRRLYELQSAFVYQSIISGRRIAVIKLLEPFKTVVGDIWYLELSDQKPNGEQVSGFDHLEIYPTNGNIEELIAELASKDVSLEKIERVHHTTYDHVLPNGFKIRIEAEPLIQKIKTTEMR